MINGRREFAFLNIVAPFNSSIPLRAGKITKQETSDSDNDSNDYLIVVNLQQVDSGLGDESEPF